MRLLVSSAVSGAAGVLLAAAFEPLSVIVAAPLSLAVLALVTHGMRPGRAWLPGLAFGVGFFFTLQWWMRAVGVDAWLGLSLLEAVFIAPLASAWAALQARSRWWPWWCALAWVAVETVRSSWPFSGMPWGRLSYAVADTAWADALPWYGFAGVSLLIALVGTCAAWMLLARPRLLGAGALVCLLAALSLAPSWLAGPPRTQGSTSLAVVQGDVPGAGDDLVSVHREVTQNHVDATRELGQEIAEGRREPVDFVLWPENSTAVDPFDDHEARTGIERAVAGVGVPVLVGAMVDDVRPDRVLNQGIVWDPATGPGDRYTKWHPVPFGEYVPWRDLIFKQNLGRLRQVGRDMVSGTRGAPLQVGTVSVADAICFDVAYDDGIQAQVRNGAELLVVQTSNAMFIHTHQIEQQYEITRLRALETGRSTAVAATNGVSGIIGPDGEPVAEARVRTTSVLTAEVPLSTEITPAVRMGLWPGRVAVLATILMLVSPLLAGFMPYIRRSPAPEPITEDAL